MGTTNNEETKNKIIEFSLFSEGSNIYPCWGIKFKHKNEVTKLCDMDKRPDSIDITFPDGKTYTFRIRPSFWNGCHEFVDAQVQEKSTGKLTRKVKPIKSLAIDELGYSIKTKNNCTIHAEVVKRNKLLQITKFE